MTTDKSKESLLEQLEEAYSNISDLLNKINSLNDLTKNIEIVTNTFFKQYKELLDTNQLKSIYEENTDAVKKIQENADKVTDTIKNLTYYKDLVSNEIEGFSQKFNTFDEELRKLKNSLSDVDKKLSNIINETEKRTKRANNDVEKTLKLLEVTVELNKYEMLEKRIADNNRMLKEIQNSLNKSNNFYPKKSKPNDILKNSDNKQLPNNSQKRIDRVTIENKNN